MSVHKGEEAVLTLIVCADPRPRHVAWEWGSLRLEAGAGYGIHLFEQSQIILFKFTFDHFAKQHRQMGTTFFLNL